MHEHHTVNSVGEHIACNDSPQDRLAERLRYVAQAFAYALGGKWVLVRVAAFFLFLSNLRTMSLYGLTAIVRPSRSGGADHSVRALMRQQNPMVFGGRWQYAAACTDTPARYRSGRVVVERPTFVEVAGRSGATHIVRGRDWILTRRIMAACFALRWPADCAAREAK